MELTILPWLMMKKKVARIIGFDESFPLIEKIKKLKDTVASYFSGKSSQIHQSNGIRECTLQKS